MPAKSRRQPRKAKATKPVLSVQEVRKITRSELLKSAETKSAYNNFATATVNNEQTYAYNLNYFIQQGASAENVIGEKVYIKNINLRGYFSSTTGSEALIGRMLLIRTKTPLGAALINATSTDIFRSTLSRRAALSHVDLHKVDLLFDKTFTMNAPGVSGIARVKDFQINVPINKTHYFDADNSGYFKDKNYYLVWTVFRPDLTTGSTSQVGDMSCAWTVNFKDE